MKAKTVVFLVFLIATKGCKAQDNTKNTPVLSEVETAQMKTFDIETFNKNKNHLNEYTIITKDSTVIEQDQWHSGYEETIKPKNSYLNEYYKYYKNGKLKLTGFFFPNYFDKGVWKEYDEQGNLIEETDYDAPYKFTWDDVLAFIKKRKIDMDNHYLEIGRNVVDGKPIWSIIWEKEDKSSLRIVGIDGITGEVFQENDRAYPIEE